MITTLAEIGYSVGEVRIVRDEVVDIASAFRQLIDRYEIVISAGGIGPTHDDVTVEGVAAALGCELETNQTMLGFLKTRYGEPLGTMVARMAELPPGTEVIGCEDGRWPLIRAGSVYLFPGLPIALADKMRRIGELLQPRQTPYTAELYVSEDESEFADWLDGFQRDLEGILIGSYPTVGAPDYRSLITVKGIRVEAVDGTAREIRSHFENNGTLIRVGGILADDADR